MGHRTAPTRASRKRIVPSRSAGGGGTGGLGPRLGWFPRAAREGGTLVARGEFSIVIAGLAVTAGIEPDLGPPATAYVLILVILGPLTARWTEPVALRLTARRRRHTRPAADGGPQPDAAQEALDGQGTAGRT